MYFISYSLGIFNSLFDLKCLATKKEFGWIFSGFPFSPPDRKEVNLKPRN